MSLKYIENEIYNTNKRDKYKLCMKSITQKSH